MGMGQDVPAAITCPHCGAPNAPGGAFCEACGKALPSAAPTGPRIVGGDLLPSSAAGQKLVGDDLRKQMNRAAYTLLAVGILQLTCGMIGVVAISRLQESPPGMAAIMVGAQVTVAAIFLGLYFWARRSPLPASIVGLIVYGTLLAVNVLAHVSQLAQDVPGQRRSGIGGLGIGILDIVVLAFLAQGIGAALKHKRMSEASLSV